MIDPGEDPGVTARREVLEEARTAAVGDDESREVAWFEIGDLPEIRASVRERVDCVLAGDPVTRVTA